MELKFKRLDDKAVLPIRAHKSDAGLDLTVTDITLEPNECGQTVVVYHSGLAVEIPEGHMGLLFPRSSIAKKSLYLTNSVGVIDAGYRGEITAKMHVTTDAKPAIYNVGERFIQLIVVPFPEITITEVSELSETERGEGGYGSSDEKISAPTADTVSNDSVPDSENNTETDDTAEHSDTATEEAAESVSGSEIAE